MIFDDVYEINLDDEPYQFWLLGVFFDPETCTYRVSTDSGCSCPIPWENHSTADYGPPLNVSQVIQAIRQQSHSRGGAMAEVKARAIAAVERFDYERIAAHL